MPAAKKKTVATTAEKPTQARRRAAPKVAAAAAVAVPVAPATTARPDKPRKIKVLRDSFTMPKSEFEVLEALKQRAARGGHVAKKSEVLRAGVLALAAMGDGAFLAALGAVPAVKTGRPAKA